MAMGHNDAVDKIREYPDTTNMNTINQDKQECGILPDAFRNELLPSSDKHIGDR